MKKPAPLFHEYRRTAFFQREIREPVPRTHSARLIRPA